MELLFEIIFSIIFEGLIEGINAKTLPMWLRIICGIIVSTVFSVIVGVIGILAISMLNEHYYILSILLLSVDLVFIIGVIKKIKKFRLK